jgi:4-amino-4-deoxy-L-arabinose transferase-like glycosyltransferase
VTHDSDSTIIPQALIGAGTAVLAFLVGSEVFKEDVGLLASMLTAIYPYHPQKLPGHLPDHFHCIRL